MRDYRGERWLVWSAGAGCVVGGGVPAVLGGGEETVFDFGGDVTVGLDDPVIDAAAESAGLRDLGDLVGNEPGLITMEYALSYPRPASLNIHSESFRYRTVAATTRRVP